MWNLGLPSNKTQNIYHVIIVIKVIIIIITIIIIIIKKIIHFI